MYRKHFGYGEQDHVPSEISGQTAQDVHHIIPRGEGGSEDGIENLIAVTRDEHDRAHGRKTPSLTRDYLQEVHRNFMGLRELHRDLDIMF